MDIRACGFIGICDLEIGHFEQARESAASDVTQKKPRTAKAACISLLTDFGDRDGYVGAMKGVIASLAPAVSVIDICHAVPPQDLLHAGLIWRSVVRFFPRGSVHVGVVDPGVGTERRILAFDALGSVFLAPDNGLIGLVLQKREVRRVVAVKDRRYFLPEVSSTFHGRDIFAPVAARIATGLDLESLGRPVRSYRRQTLPRPRRRRVGPRSGATTGRRTTVEERGEVMYVDRFGNVVTNIPPREGVRLKRMEAARSHCFDRVEPTYGSVPAGTALLLVGSLGFLEIAVNRGSAARDLDLRPGDRVVAVWEESR